MHETHDPDLIAAYADGDLEGDTSTIEEQLSSCAECAAEFALQREIRSMLTAAAPVGLSDDERTTLRAGVHDRLQQGARVVPLASRASARRWWAIGSVAAAAFAVVGVAGLLLNGGGDDAGTADQTFAASATTAGEAADAARSMADSFETQSATSTTQAPEETAAAAEDGGGDDAMSAFLSYSEVGAISTAELGDLATNTVESLQAGVPADELTAAWFNDRELPTPSCLARVADPLFAVISAIVDGEPVEVLVVRDEDGLFRAEHFALEGCEPR